MTVDFDVVLNLVGGFGRYQKLRFGLLCLSIAAIYQFPFYYYIFASFTPPFQCKSYVGAGANSTVNLDPLSGPPWNVSDDQCSVTVTDSDGTPQLHACSEWTFDQSEYQSTIVTQWGLVCDRAWWLTFIQALQNVSVAVGTLLFAIVQDWLGRKLGFFISIGTAVVFGVWSAFATSPAMYTVARSFQVLMVISGWSIPYISAIEIVGTSHRTVVTSTMIAIFSLGGASVGLVAWMATDWITLALLSCAPLACLSLYWFVLDESPRWLLTQRKSTELQRVCYKIASENGIDQAMGDEKGLMIKAEIDSLLMDLKSEMDRSGKNSDEGDGLKVWDLFKTANIRSKTILVSTLFIVNAVVYRGLAFNVDNLQGNRFLNFSLLMLMEIPAGVIIFFLGDKLGRILTMSFMMVFGGMAAVAISQIPPEQSVVIMSLALVSELGISVSFTTLCQLASELFPTHLRGTGSGFGGFMGNLGTATVPFIIATNTISKSLPMVIMGFISLAGGLIVLLLPETVGKSLPQTIADCQETDVGMPTFWANITFSGIKKNERLAVKEINQFKSEKESCISSASSDSPDDLISMQSAALTQLCEEA